jgi:hypothetical protein
MAGRQSPSPVLRTKKVIDQDSITPEQLFAEAGRLLLYWALNDEYAVKLERQGKHLTAVMEHAGKVIASKKGASEGGGLGDLAGFSAPVDGDADTGPATTRH